MRPGTSWCPEVGLGIPNLTSGQFRSFDETFELLVCMGPLENDWFCTVLVRAALYVRRRMFLDLDFVLSLRARGSPTSSRCPDVGLGFSGIPIVVICDLARCLARTPRGEVLGVLKSS